jgi:hypothetical protein
MQANEVPAAPLLPVVRLTRNRSPSTVGIAVALFFGALGSIPLVLGAAQQGVTPRDLANEVIQLIANSAALGYLTGILVFESRRLTSDFATIRPHLLERDGFDDRDLFLRNRRPRTLAALTVLGAVAGAVLNYSYGGALHQALNGRPIAWATAWAPLVIVPLWAGIFHLLWVFLDNARLLGRIARSHVVVDPAELGSMDVFAGAGIRYLWMIVIGLAVIPVQGILTGSLKPIDVLPTLAVVGPVGALLLFLPIYGAHKGIAAAITREIERLDALLRQAAPHSDRFLLLSLYRGQLADTPAWPLSLRSLARIALYLVIPPLAWVAAALVESLVSDMM